MQFSTNSCLSVDQLFNEWLVELLILLDSFSEGISTPIRVENGGSHEVVGMQL